MRYCIVDDAMFSHKGASGPKSSIKLCFTQFAGWRHRDEVCRLRLVLPVIIHAGCLAAGVGRAFSRVCTCMHVCLFVRALKGKRLELWTRQSVAI